VNCNHVGKAGEYRVCSELMLKGFEPLLSIVDSGIDIVLTNGKTIQVKTSNKRISQKGKFHYAFPFQDIRYYRGKSTGRNKIIADFAICWAVPDNLFLIIPKHEVGDRYNLTVSISPTWKSRPSYFMKFKNKWELLK
jgi:hypothetical protein